MFLMRDFVFASVALFALFMFNVIDTSEDNNHYGLVDVNFEQINQKDREMIICSINSGGTAS